MRSKLLGGSEKTTLKRGHLAWPLKYEFSMGRIHSQLWSSVPKYQSQLLLGSVAQTQVSSQFPLSASTLTNGKLYLLSSCPQPKTSALCCHVGEREGKGREMERVRYLHYVTNNGKVQGLSSPRFPSEICGYSSHS